VTNGLQTGDKLVTNGLQTGDKLVTNGLQTGDKLVTNDENSNFTIDLLSGTQRKILLELNALSEKNNHISTGPIYIHTLAKNLQMPYSTCKTSIHRLVVKGFLERSLSKQGKNGFTVFKIMTSVRRQIKRDLSTDLQSKSYPQEPQKAPHIYSSSNIINTMYEEDHALTGKQEDKILIDIEPLEGIGFMHQHIDHIKSVSGLSDDVIQQSIYAFAFDLDTNNKADKIKSGTPLNYFVGTLRKGKPYLPPANYESPQIRCMRLFLEGINAERVKIQKLENEMIDHYLIDWEKTLIEQDIINIIPDKRWRDDKESPVYKSYLKNYFREHVWPDMKKSNNRMGF
jgi:hypothetical protein